VHPLIELDILAAGAGPGRRPNLIFLVLRKMDPSDAAFSAVDFTLPHQTLVQVINSPLWRFRESFAREMPCS
jgi:hypothetical protein